MPNYTVESSTVETPDGVNLRKRIFIPKQVTKDNNKKKSVVLVHPLVVRILCKGLLPVTFDMRGVGRSTGKSSLTEAPIAGSAVDQLEQVVGYVRVPFQHDGLNPFWTTLQCHPAVTETETVMGTRDGFTSVNQLNNKLKSAARRTEKRLIKGVSHFEMKALIMMPRW